MASLKGKFHSTLNAKRIADGLTWVELAQAIGGFTAAMLTRLSKPGGRVGFPAATRLTRWLGRPVAAFTRAALLPASKQRTRYCVLITASSYLPAPMPVSAKMPRSAIHLKVSSYTSLV